MSLIKLKKLNKKIYKNNLIQYNNLYFYYHLDYLYLYHNIGNVIIMLVSGI